jgi:hypothetical protein
MARTKKVRRRRVRDWIGGVALAILSSQGCNASDSAMDSGSRESSDNSGNSNGTPTVTTGEGTSSNVSVTTGGNANLPSEIEVNVDFDAPQASVGYVYATNPEQDSVAVINAKTLAIQIVETGDEPRFLQTIPGKDSAIFIDVAAKDIAYLQTEGEVTTVQYFTGLPAANTVAVAPDGKHAIAYFDFTRLHEGTVETLQDITVMSLEADKPVTTRMTIGCQARKVTFAGGESGADAAYVVTDDGVSIVKFADVDANGSSLAKTVPVFSAIEQNAADVSVTPDGKYALGRIEGSSQIRLVELETGIAQNLDLSEALPGDTTNNGGSGGGGGTGGTNVTAQGGAAIQGGATGTSTGVRSTITDLDLSADGSYALAVSRERSTLVRIPIPDGFENPELITKTKIDGVLVGAAAVSPNGHWAVLYTSVVTEERIVVVDLTNETEPYPLDLKKAVEGVTFSSTGEQAFVVHQKVDGDPTETTITTEQMIDRSYGYSLVDLKDRFRKILITDATPQQTMAVPETPYVFLTFTGTNHKIQRINMDTFVDDSIDLGTHPVSMGVVPSAKRIFVNQEHVEGRMTFIDWDTMATRSVTGYELNSMIRE